MTEWNASGYDRVAELQRAMAEEVLSALELKGTEHLLDLGCGNGKITAEIAARLPHGTALGIDASAKMIEFACRQFGPAVHPNLRFQSADIRDLALCEPFDRVVSFNALHWIPEQQMALHTIRKAMKPEGVAQLRLVPDGERKSLETVIEETRRSTTWSSHFHGFRDPYLHILPERYQRLAQQCGLRVLRLAVSDKVWDFGSREAFESFGAVTFVEWTKRLPELERPRFVSDVLDRYRAQVTSARGEENMFRFYQMDVTLAREKEAT